MNKIQKIQMPKRFQRSIRIDTDFDDISILETFINSNTANRALEDLCHHISSAGQCAFTWTGPYGSGKSSLAVMFNASLKHGGTKNKQIAKKLLNFSTIETIDNTFKKHSERIVIPIVAGRKNIEEQVLKELKSYSKLKSKDLIQVVNDIISKKQLILIIDELGKALDYASYKREDIFILQEIAELANRSEGNFIFIGILHQSFSEYANNLSINAKKEWSKIQGRFLDISVNSSVEEQIKLLSTAVSNTSNNWVDYDPYKSIINFIKNFSSNHSWASEKIFMHLWPLNPIFALALGPMTKKSFSQNQRSLFTFLNSSEPHGFKNYIDSDNVGNNKFYGLQNFWNYLDTNYSNIIANSNDSHNWSLANDCIYKAKELDLPLVEDIVIIIASIQIFGLKNYLSADKESIYASLPLIDTKEIDEALDKLVESKIILLRKLDQVYLLTEGSDFNIDFELKIFLDRYKNLTSEKITSIKQFKQILAKRHYINTGYIRTLDYFISPISNLINYNDSSFKNKIILSLSTENETNEKHKKIITNFLKNINYPCIIGFIENSIKIADSIREYLALVDLRTEHHTMLDDRIARNEVDLRIRSANLNLEQELENLSHNSTWYFSSFNSKKTIIWDSTSIKNISNRITKLNEKISLLFDNFYPEAPIIKNELLNKKKITTNASSALKKFLIALNTHPNEHNLGITGNPPELSIYNSIIKNHSLCETYSKNKYKLVLPKKSKSKNMYLLFKETEKFLINKEKVMANDISNLWAMPPFGIPQGLYSLLMFLFMTLNRKNLAVYREDIYEVDYHDVTIDYILRNLKEFSITWVSYDENEKDYTILAKNCAKIINRPIEPVPLLIGKALKEFFKKQEEWTKVTRNLTEKTLLFRDELKKANDPIDFILKQVPMIFNKDEDVDVKALKNSLKEINNCFDNLLFKFKNCIHENFSIIDNLNSYEEIQNRAVLLKDKTGDHELNSIIIRLQNYDGSKEKLMNLLNGFALKPIGKIYDYDIDRIMIDIAVKAQQFKKSEAFLHVSNRRKTRTAFSFIHGEKNNKEATSKDFTLSKKEEKQAEKLAKELEEVIKEKEGLFTNNPITLGAIAKLISERLDSDNE